MMYHGAKPDEVIEDVSLDDDCLLPLPEPVKIRTDFYDYDGEFTPFLEVDYRNWSL
jgi:hypothetical protein